MKIIEKKELNKLVPEECKKLKDKEQNENEEEYLCKEAYIPKSLTLEKCKEKFVEVEEEV